MSALRSSAGPGGLHERHVELGGEDLGQRGLAQSRGPRQEHVVQRVAAAGGGRDRDRQLVAQAVLADEVLEPSRSQRSVELDLLAGDLAGLVHRAHRLALRSAWAIRSSALSPSAPRSSESISSPL